MGNYRKLTKHFKIGNYDFTLGINREMAYRFYKHEPKILEYAKQASALQDKMSKINSDNELSTEDYFALATLAYEIEKCTKTIVDFALPEMLEYGGMNDCNTKQYAESLINFCDDNDILYNDEAEDENGETVSVKGVYTYIMEFIQLGFTGGKGMPSNNKPKVKIIIE